MESNSRYEITNKLIAFGTTISPIYSYNSVANYFLVER